MDEILIVGDIHGSWGRLNTLITKKSPDIVLQCGDFGWWPSMEVNVKKHYARNKWELKGVKPGNSKIYWCDGNHEEHVDLVQDGLIHEMYDCVYHASRGSVLVLPDGRNVLFVGGADSIDKQFRTNGIDWFASENISQRDFETIMSVDVEIDIVISHTCPTSFDILDSREHYSDVNRLVLDEVLIKYKPSYWYFGHWHKFRTGKFENTFWTCLSFPGGGGRWWTFLPKGEYGRTEC